MLGDLFGVCLSLAGATFNAVDISSDYFVAKFWYERSRRPDIHMGGFLVTISVIILGGLAQTTIFFYLWLKTRDRHVM